MIKSNEYFEGKVRSLAFENQDGPATVGVMLPGDYTFGTSTPETMRVISGLLQVKLPGADRFADYGPGSSFSVAAGTSFDLKVPVASAYLCLYS